MALVVFGEKTQKFPNYSSPASQKNYSHKIQYLNRDYELNVCSS
jgi:hypothetical protein